MRKINKKTLERDAKHIFSKIYWGNTLLSYKDIMEILKDKNRKKERIELLKKIFFNMQDAFLYTVYFDDEEIKEFLNTLRIPKIFPHLEEKKKLWRHIFLGEKYENELFKWRT